MSGQVTDIAQAAVEAAFAELDKLGLRGKEKDLARALIDALRKKEDVVEVMLVTPSGDAGPLANEITTMLEKKLGRSVLIRQKADAAMIGGIQLLIGDMLIDRSVRRQLEEFASSLSL